MLLLAHMGIGSRLVKPWAKNLPKWGLLLGCVLPDLVDKPIYYGQLFYCRMTGASMGPLNDSRTIGHTALFLLVFALLAFTRRSRLLAALTLGIATHLMLDALNDNLVDYLFPSLRLPEELKHSSTATLFWPISQVNFPPSPFPKFADHMSRSFNPLSLGFEVVGLMILLWDRWQSRHEPEIHQFFTLKRRKRREMEHRRKSGEL